MHVAVSRWKHIGVVSLISFHAVNKTKGFSSQPHSSDRIKADLIQHMDLVITHRIAGFSGWLRESWRAEGVITSWRHAPSLAGLVKQAKSPHTCSDAIAHFCHPFPSRIRVTCHTIKPHLRFVVGRNAKP